MPKPSILIASFLVTAFVLAGCRGDLPTGEEVDYTEDVKPLIESTGKAKVRGSCNFIDSQSVCIDFVGDVFTEERMKLSCADGVFSWDACPYSDLGGCQATPDTVSESIAWSYAHGGMPITAEEAGYQAKACNALAAAKWVVPGDLIAR